MIYGVEQSTDIRERRTKIVKFKSEASARKWKQTKSGNFTYDNPEEARNYHKTFRELYILDGKIDKKDSIFHQQGTSTYPRSYEDNLAMYIWKYGKELA